MRSDLTQNQAIREARAATRPAKRAVGAAIRTPVRVRWATNTSPLLRMTAYRCVSRKSKTTPLPWRDEGPSLATYEGGGGVVAIVRPTHPQCPGFARCELTGGEPVSQDLARFEFGGHEFRAILIDGNPWFVASDIAVILGYRDAERMTRRLDPDEKSTQKVPRAARAVDPGYGGDQEMTVISEPGLYAAVLGSQVPTARAFQRKITHEVIPSIRRTGSYSVVPAQQQRIPQSFAVALQLAAEQQFEIERQQAAIAEMEPKALMAQELIDANGDMDVRYAAQILAHDNGIDIGEVRLFRFMREQAKWLDKANRPYQKYIDRGWLRVKPQTRPSKTCGRKVADPQVRITYRGLAELHRLLSPPGRQFVIRPRLPLDGEW